MMVPQLISRLIEDVSTEEIGIRRVYDPFMGSGTVLTESMLAGLEFSGRDVNPLAVLLCKVKAGPFSLDTLNNSVDELICEIAIDQEKTILTQLTNWRKWFTFNVAMWLSRILRAIRGEHDLWTRRFFWVALAETVRVTSNSRTSTFKLHIRSAEDLLTRDPKVFQIFAEILTRNVKKLTDFTNLLRAKDLLKGNSYSEDISLEYVTSKNTAAETQISDLLVTSPPYGDNTTTVPYGQHSYLPLHWIDLKDIDENIEEDILSTTRSIDNKSLGGSLKYDENCPKLLYEKSETLRNILDKLPKKPVALRNKVISFYNDLNSSILEILPRVADNSTLIWIIGDRQVGQQLVPLSKILQELLTSHNCSPVTSIPRRIPSKRMAGRNNVASTMKAETLLVMKSPKAS
ncbi:site-specific DNA-methyltransferase [soil metagenome]